MIDKKTCKHQFTFRREDLFNVNPIFSKKTCELCGETIVMDSKSKVRVVLFTLCMAIILILIPPWLKAFLPEVSYFAKTLVVALIFVTIFGYGLYRVMNTAVYKKYEPRQRIGEDAYEESKQRHEERTREFWDRHNPRKKNK